MHFSPISWLRFSLHESSFVPSMRFARQHTAVSPQLLWPCAPPSDVCAGAGRCEPCTGSSGARVPSNECIFPSLCRKLRGSLVSGLGGYLYCYIFHPCFWISFYFCGFLYLRDRHEQLHSKIEPGPRLCPSMREGASTSISR